MGYGGGVALITLGLILALAVEDRLGGVDLRLVGWILALAGAVLVVITLIQANTRRTRRTVASTSRDDGTEVVRERRTEEPPPAI
ncbi:DUF6458 family protein [Nocardioides sp.]|uniref:DUF6458 family protein n=1 Tax=Nocardioides sp. TaxID=35761 RepID=UPI0027352D38|nr:DUF6458 family protein [Nocardioides sp.]MDP3893662.1 DUF6458 family protein [Nocardioides sp.]